MLGQLVIRNVKVADRSRKIRYRFHFLVMQFTANQLEIPQILLDRTVFDLQQKSAVWGLLLVVLIVRVHFLEELSSAFVGPINRFKPSAPFVLDLDGERLERVLPMEKDNWVPGLKKPLCGSRASRAVAEVLDRPDGVLLQRHFRTTTGNEDNMLVFNSSEWWLSLHLGKVFNEFLNLLLNSIFHIHYFVRM